MPAGPLSYLICILRALHCFRQEIRAAGVSSKVGGDVNRRGPAACMCFGAGASFAWKPRLSELSGRPPLHCRLPLQVPGLLEIHSPQQRRISFLLPLEARQELLPF